MFKQASIACCTKVKKWLMYTGKEYVKLELSSISDGKKKKHRRRRIMLTHKKTCWGTLMRLQKLSQKPNQKTEVFLESRTWWQYKVKFS